MELNCIQYGGILRDCQLGRLAKMHGVLVNTIFHVPFIFGVVNRDERYLGRSPFTIHYYQSTAADGINFLRIHQCNIYSGARIAYYKMNIQCNIDGYVKTKKKSN